MRQLIPDLGCAGTLRVVVDTSGVNIGAVLRMRGVFQKMGHVMDRMYPCRLQVRCCVHVLSLVVVYAHFTKSGSPVPRLDVGKHNSLLAWMWCLEAATSW